MIKKPSIGRSYPPSKQDWEAMIETIEILTGRRGDDDLATPALTPLTFSNPPTKAECEALFQYVNRQRAAIKIIVERLDS